MGGKSTISHSRSNQDGGAFAVLSGSVSVAGGSRVVQSSALQRGGCVYTQGGAQVGIRTNVSPGPSHMRSAPQLNPLLIRAGSIHFIRSFIEAAEAGGAGSIIFSTGAAQSDGPLVLATLTEFRQHACDRALFRQDGPSQFVFRNITLVRLSGCDAATLNSADAFAGVRLKRCGEEYRDSQSRGWSVCNSIEPESCTEQPVSGTALTTLVCSCPPPLFIEPESQEPALAPYVQAGDAPGCVLPRRLAALQVVSEELAVRISKPDHVTIVRNVSILMEGDDWQRTASWNILDPASVSSRSPWLYLPLTSGNVDGASEVSVSVGFNASGLRELAGPYLERLFVHVHSAIPEAGRTQVLRVALTIQARTSSAAWGHSCAGSGNLT